MQCVGTLILVVAIIINAAAQPAHAYIDPGSTSMLLQMIVGGIAAVFVVTRRLWTGTLQRATRLLRRDPNGHRDPGAHGESGK